MGEIVVQMSLQSGTVVDYLADVFDASAGVPAFDHSAPYSLELDQALRLDDSIPAAAASRLNSGIGQSGPRPLEVEHR